MSPMRVTLQDCSLPAVAHPGLEWVRAVPPQAVSSQAEGRPEELQNAAQKAPSL